MGWRIFDEAVEIAELRHRYLPHIFHWRGQRLKVEAVESVQTVSRRGWRGRTDRRLFRVQCSEGTFELCHDLEANAWHLRRAKLAGVRPVVARQVAPAWP
jgi:hypothetical protein